MVVAFSGHQIAEETDEMSHEMCCLGRLPGHPTLRALFILDGKLIRTSAKNDNYTTIIYVYYYILVVIII